MKTKKRTPLLSINDLQKQCRKEFMQIDCDYIYDLKGNLDDVWAKLFQRHDDCAAVIEGKKIIFACYNCILAEKKICFWIKEKNEMQKRGTKYIE